MGVGKANHEKGTGPQRLIMNIIPSNDIQETIEGDMACLPNDSQWRCITMRSGETLRWSAADLKRCFYVFRLPPAWRQWM
eukprot:11467823-Karenia_brevis.AAC.1